KTNLRNSVLQNADLTLAKANNAIFACADLSGAKLEKANLSGADLSSTNLDRADLSQADIGSAVIAYADIAEANYAPRSAPPDLYLAGLQGVESTSFPEGQEVALVQLRDLLQKAGLRDLERDATYAIEKGRTKY